MSETETVTVEFVDEDGVPGERMTLEEGEERESNFLPDGIRVRCISIDHLEWCAECGDVRVDPENCDLSPAVCKPCRHEIAGRGGGPRE